MISCYVLLGLWNFIGSRRKSCLLVLLICLCRPGVARGLCLSMLSPSSFMSQSLVLSLWATSWALRLEPIPSGESAFSLVFHKNWAVKGFFKRLRGVPIPCLLLFICVMLLTFGMAVGEDLRQQICW